MRGSVVGQLILKDWRLQRTQIAGSIVGGGLALGLITRATETAVVVGTICFFISIILVGTMLPLAGILNERKNHNLAFLMSLPVSSIQYTTSKLVSSHGNVSDPLDDAGGRGRALDRSCGAFRTE